MFYYLALLSPCAVCLIGATWMLCSRKYNTKAQNILSLTLLLSCVSFFCMANYIVGVTGLSAYRILDTISSFITLIIIPTIYLYFRSLTSESPLIWKDYIWFLPAIVIGVGTCVLYLTMDNAKSIDYIQSVLIERRRRSLKYSETIYRMHYLISVGFYNLTVLVQILGIGTYIVVGLRSYLHYLREPRFNLEGISIEVGSKMFFWFMLTILLTWGVILPGGTFWKQYPVLTGIYFTGWAVVCFGIFYCGSQRKNSEDNSVGYFEQIVPKMVYNNYSTLVKGETKNDILGEKLHPKYAEHLAGFRKLMEEEHIFLRNCLRAEEVAIAINTNRTYLSRMIKREFDCTFSDYTNRKRIEYSKKLMRANPQIKQYQLAEQSGFLSASTFCKTFKAMMGETTKEWIRREVLKNEFY